MTGKIPAMLFLSRTDRDFVTGVKTLPCHYSRFKNASQHIHIHMCMCMCITKRKPPCGVAGKRKRKENFSFFPGKSPNEERKALTKVLIDT